MKLLDLYCAGGGAGWGYHLAGYEVTGVDILHQKHYPLTFIQSDALDYLAEHGHEYDLIHASPPCQVHSRMTRKEHRANHLELIGPTRDLLQKMGLPYIIENVEDARDFLRSPIMLCGTMFGLQTPAGNQLRRHRLFELSWASSLQTPECNHNDLSAVGVHGGGQHPARRRSTDPAADFTVKARRQVMQIDWLTRDELSQAIPPAYTQWLGMEYRSKLEDLHAKQRGAE